MSKSRDPGAEYYAAGSYQQQYSSNPAGAVPPSGGISDAREKDAAYAQRLQQEEFRNAQHQPLPTTTGHPMRQPTNGTRYVTMYPSSAAFDPSDLGVTGNFIAPHEVRLMEAHSLGKTMQILAVFDGLILLLNCASFYILYVLVIWGPLAGWMAGTRFSIGWTYVYVCYYILRLSGDLAYVLSGYLWFVLVFVINLIIARYILRFARVLNTLTPAEVEQLRNPSAVWSGQQGAYRHSQPFQML